MTASLTNSTIKQYESSLRYWWFFCQKENFNPYSADEQTILRCLTRKFSDGANYSSLNTMRSAIALINNQSNSDSNLLQRFFKGIYKLRTPAPRYNFTWDVSIVLDTLANRNPIESLDLRQLSLKLTMLLALRSSFRMQSIALIKTDNIKFNNQGVEIKIDELIKTSRPGAPLPYAWFPFFREKPQLCIAQTLLHYLEKTKLIRKDCKNLLLSFKEPHKPIGSQTISRWLKMIMEEAGVDEVFKLYSTRHASTSKASQADLDINSIKNAAGWSQRTSTLAKFYNKPIKRTSENFAKAVFSN
ncbi:uncharacterized protein LOC122505421 [Leptopilina heterotoma]|uniref:uncharacterized protein LOC122505421 n=1 Tax=Leptopilina heterotoma TaxID=63436 RepID=UPI001CA99047|nr:uncharacterized protein LOC122505421 [Leptopilina heterotoma]